MKRNICFLLCLCAFFGVRGQDIKVVNKGNGDSVSAGLPVPKGVIRQVIHFRADSFSFADFKGKLVILDFWATYCKPCLELLPAYERLQQEMGGKVQFMLVTRENGALAAACLDRLHITLPSVTSDKALGLAFPHTSIPHEVWIRDGRVVSTTFGESVNAAVISRVLEGGVAAEQKKDNLAFDELAPLLVNGNGGTGRVLYQSLVTPYIAGLSSRLGFRSDSGRLISFGVNLSALRLYQQAFSHLDPLLELDNRYVLLLPDSLKNRVDRGRQLSFHEWIVENGFCYDLVLPPGFSGDVSALMVSDLNRFFGVYLHLSATLERRTVDCLVLSKARGAESLRSAGGEAAFSVTDTSYSQENLPVSCLVMQLAQQYRHLSTPLVDETGYREPVDISLHTGLEDLGMLQEELLKSGLLLRVEKRAIPLVVIRPVRDLKTDFLIHSHLN